jgi:hypothetical protein
MHGEGSRLEPQKGGEEMICIHWIWLLVVFSVGSCLGFLAFAICCSFGSGDYYPSIEDAEQLYRPRENIHRFKPRGE